jgi:RIO-like serine/threonine protein kinase
MYKLFIDKANAWITKYDIVPEEAIQKNLKLGEELDDLLAKLVNIGLLETKEEDNKIWYRATDLGTSYAEDIKN